jgi:hypothetical protein
MNETVKALMLEAGYAAPELAGRANKLTELIVKECATHLHRRGVEGFGILEERNLKEHFGVEE